MTPEPGTTVELVTAHFGDGPKSALLLHGLTSNADLWWRLGPAIGDLGYSVTAPDLRGHGLSPRTERYEIAAYAADVGAVDGGPWDLVVAHSLGGAIIVDLILRQPGFAGALILIDPLIRARDLDPDEMLETYMEPFAKPMTVDQVAADNPRWHLGDVERKAESLRQASPDMVKGTLLHNKGWNRVGDMADISVPTLVLGADPAEDPLVPPELGREIAAANSNIEFVVVAGGSHSMHRDSFEATWEAIETWLTGSSARV